MDRRMTRAIAVSGSVILCAAGATMPGCGESDYDVRGAAPASGSTVRTETMLRMAGGNLSIAVAGQNVSGQFGMTAWETTDAEVLEVDGAGEPSRYRVHVVSDVAEQAMSFFGMPEEKEVVRGPMHDQTMTAERGGDGWRVRLVSGEPTEEQEAALRSTEEALAAGHAPLYPAHRVKVGESWDVSGRQMSRWIVQGMEEIAGSATFTLTSVTDFNGERCARINVDVNVSGAMTDEDGETVHMELSLTGDIYRSLETYIDLQTELRGTMSIRGDIDLGSETGQLRVSGPVTVSASESWR